MRIAAREDKGGLGESWHFGPWLVVNITVADNNTSAVYASTTTTTSTTTESPTESKSLDEKIAQYEAELALLNDDYDYIYDDSDSDSSQISIGSDKNKYEKKFKNLLKMLSLERSEKTPLALSVFYSVCFSMLYMAAFALLAYLIKRCIKSEPLVAALTMAVNTIINVNLMGS